MNTHRGPQPPYFIKRRRTDRNEGSSSSRLDEAPACRRFSKILAVFLLISVMMTAGCFGNRIKPDEPSRRVKNWTADEILEVISQRAQAIRQVKTLITVKIDGKRPPGFFLPGRTIQAALWTERPDLIRLQGFNPFGGTLFDLVSKEGRLQLSVPGRSKEVQARLEEMLIRNGEWSSFSSEFLDGLAGGGQSLTRPSELSAVEQNGREIVLYQFFLNKGRSRLVRKYFLDADRLLTRQAVYFDLSGRPSVTLLYRDYLVITSPQEAPRSEENTAGRAENFWPREITAILNDKGRLLVTFSEVSLNQPFQAGAFSLGAKSR
jgi:hypothetical protein